MTSRTGNMTASYDTELHPALEADKPSDPVLTIHGLSIGYRTDAGLQEVVSHLDLVVPRGEAVGIVGESGCGKSTVAKSILRIMERNAVIRSGSIVYDGQNLLKLGEKDMCSIRGGQIAFVPQEPMISLNPTMRIEEQLREVLDEHPGTGARHDILSRLTKALQEVGIADVTRVLRGYPHQMSGGQLQRVLIAMALLGQPKLLILDEPTTALDVTIEAGIVSLIGNLSRRHGMSILLISHNLGIVKRLCSQIAVMYAGQVVEQGPTEEVYRRQQHPYTRGLFGCVPSLLADAHERPLSPIPGSVPVPGEVVKGCRFAPRCPHYLTSECDREIELRTGEAPDTMVRCRRDVHDRGVEAQFSAKLPITSVSSEPILNVHGLKKSYLVKRASLLDRWFGLEDEVVQANRNINFSLERGRTLAIVGESGSGKSTLAKVICGLDRATDGRVEHRGKNIGEKTTERRDQEQLRSIQLVFQNPAGTLNPSHTVGYQIERTIRKLVGERRRSTLKERRRSLLALVKVPEEFARKMPRHLSGGQKQRIAIARALAGDAEIVVADEPVSALDVSVQAAILSLLSDIKERKSVSLILISHDLSVVRYLADRIVVMYNGKIVESGAASSVFDPPYHPYTEALLSAIPAIDESLATKRIILTGEVPSLLNPPVGCPFHTRCHRKIGQICELEPPPLRIFASGHQIECHLDETGLLSIPSVFQRPIAVEDGTSSHSVDLDE